MDPIPAEVTEIELGRAGELYAAYGYDAAGKWIWSADDLAETEALRLLIDFEISRK